MATMKAAVMHEPGNADVLKIESRPIPKADKGQVLIRVKAFGLNRSELFTRQGHSPGLTFPRILGIEATGIVEDAPGHEFQKGMLKHHEVYDCRSLSLMQYILHPLSPCPRSAHQSQKHKLR